MAITKMASGDVIVSITSEEDEAALRAEQAEYAKGKPMRDWQTAMAETDATMTRQSEDIIGTMSDAQKAKLPQYIQDAYAAKVTLRGEKP